MAKSPTNYIVVNLILRIVTAVVLTLSITVMVMNTFKVVNQDGTENKVTFKEVYPFRYLVLVSLVAFGYNVLQIIPAIFLLITRRLVCPPFTLYFDFIADKVVAYLLASSASAALAVAYEGRRIYLSFVSAFLFNGDNQDVKKVDRFFVKAETSAALALIATLTMIVLSIISARFLFRNYYILFFM